MFQNLTVNYIAVIVQSLFFQHWREKLVEWQRGYWLTNLNTNKTRSTHPTTHPHKTRNLCNYCTHLQEHKTIVNKFTLYQLKSHTNENVFNYTLKKIIDILNQLWFFLVALYSTWYHRIFYYTLFFLSFRFCYFYLLTWRVVSSHRVSGNPLNLWKIHLFVWRL